MQFLLNVSALTGSVTVLASLFLLYKKRITLDRIGSNPTVKEEAIKAEIFNALKISSNVPAIALFVIGLLLIAIPLFTYPKSEQRYTVRGTVRKDDAASPRDVLIITRYPPLYPSAEGEIISLEVWRGPDGKFPVVSFSHPDYSVEPLDLNDTGKVEFRNTEIRIKKGVQLLRLP